MKKPTYKVISITVDIDLHNKIRPILDKKRLSLGKLLDKAIENYLKKEDKKLE